MCEKYYQNYLMIIAIAIFVIVRFITISINVFSRSILGKFHEYNFSGGVRFPFTFVRFHFQAFNYIFLLVNVVIDQLLQYFRLGISLRVILVVFDESLIRPRPHEDDCKRKR